LEKINIRVLCGEYFLNDILLMIIVLFLEMGLPTGEYPTTVNLIKVADERGFYLF